jgi:transposase
MAGKKGAKHGTLQGLTQAKAAELCGVSTATMSTWVRQSKIKVLADGSVDPADPQIAGKRSTRGAVKGAKEPSNVIDYYAERAKVEALEVQKLQHELDVQKGRFIPKKAVEDAETQIAMVVAEGIEDATEQIIAWFASMSGLPEHRIREGVEARIYEIREAMADEIEARSERGWTP